VAGGERSADAGGGAATDSYDGIRDVAVDVHGLADVYGQGNFNRPASGTTQLRAFDGQTDRPALGMARLTLAHKPGLFGFRLDVGVGDIANGYLRYDPASADHPDVSRLLSYVEQAFVTATVPVGRGLLVDIGKFGTPVGLEDNEALQNWNYSRSLLYLLAEPSYHAGLRLTYALADTLAVSLFWVNGWDTNVLDGNGMRGVGAAVSWKPVPELELVADTMDGPERAPTRLSDPAVAFRSELDAYARYQLTESVALAWTGDWGRDGAEGGVVWWGVGGYCRVEPLDWLAGSVRAEHYSDDDGFTSGAKQRLEEITATAELRGKVSVVRWVGRLEGRRDVSDVPFFVAGASTRLTHQQTLGVSLVLAF
jgi:hypothetical protein